MLIRKVYKSISIIPANSKSSYMSNMQWFKLYISLIMDHFTNIDNLCWVSKHNQVEIMNKFSSWISWDGQKHETLWYFFKSLTTLLEMDIQSIATYSVLQICDN